MTDKPNRRFNINNKINIKPNNGKSNNITLNGSDFNIKQEDKNNNSKIRLPLTLNVPKPEKNKRKNAKRNKNNLKFIDNTNYTNNLHIPNKLTVQNNYQENQSIIYNKKKKDVNKPILPDNIRIPINTTKTFITQEQMNAIVSNLRFSFADVSIAIESSGRKNELRSGTLIDDFKNFKNYGKKLYTKAPQVIRDADHKFALLLGGDCNKNLGDACNRDLIAMWAEILDPVYGIKSSNVWVTTQLTAKIKKTFKNSKVREMTPSNFEKTLAELLLAVLSIPKNEKVFIYLHYSGHGYQIPNKLKFKKGNRDEAILVGPTTLATGADIRDNFFAHFGSNVQIFSLWDACHSGSIADLPFKWDGRSWENCTINENKRKKIEAKIVSISACDDNQVDAQITGNIIGYGGALTIFFYETDQYYKIDNPIIVHSKISSSAKKIRQLPILTSSWKFN